MKLSDYPVPTNNNGFGWHWFPALADVAPLDKTVALLQRMQGTGAKWVKLITSPGGDIGWERGNINSGACEMTFCAALDLNMGVVVRLFNSWQPPYLTGAVKANLLHLCHLAGDKQFYVECGNEIDAEAAGPIDRVTAEAIVNSICDFIDWCREATNGQIIPVWPSFGYGGQGYNWFQIAHDLGQGACLDRCAVAVHNYASANRLFEPYDPVYIAGTPISQSEYDVYPWRFGVNVPGENPRPLSDINAKRADNANKRAQLHTDQEIMAEFASGWYTYKWAMLQLNALGHTETPLMLTETGTRVGEMVDWEPRVDPLLHQQRTLDMISDIRQQPRIIMSSFWLFIGKMFVPIQPTWEDQCCISPTWDRKYNTTMPAGEYAQIKTPGQLPIIDELEAHPVTEGKDMTSKLGFHIQDYSTPVADAITTVQPSTVKVMGNALNPGVIQDIRQRSPHSLIIGRFWQGQQPYDNPSQQAINLADGIESTDCGSLVDYWESYNEVANNLLNPTQVDLLDQFFLAFQQVIRARWQKKTVIICSPCGNLGWPGEPSPLDFQRSLADADTLVSFHGYGWHYSPADDRVAYLFRPFTLMAQVLDKYPDKKFIFTEMGCTRMAVRGYPNDWGWSYNSADLNGPYSRTEYKQVLRDILTEANKYPSLLGVNIFETGAAGDWVARGFESISEVKEVAMEAILPPIYEVPIRVLIDGTVQTMELENYLTAVVPAEMPALWPMEALKAQAVAARTYALWRIEHPAGATFDLYADARDQVYNPSMIHPNSTAAVQATQGLYVEPQPTRYISKCG